MNQISMELLEEVVKHCSYLTRSSLKLSSHLGATIVRGVTDQLLLTSAEYNIYRGVVAGTINGLSSPEVERVQAIRMKVIGDPHHPNRLDPTTNMNVSSYTKPKRLIF